MTAAKRHTTTILLAVLLALGGAGFVHAQDPAGYELFDPTPVDSFHVVDTTSDVIYSIMRGGYRPIAIELTKTWGDQYDWRFSAAFIESTGKFERMSMPLWNYTAEGLKTIEDTAIRGDWWIWLPIDIKNRWVTVAPGQNERRYATVFVENPEGWEWTFVLGGSEAELNQLDNQGWRPISLTIYNDAGLHPRGRYVPPDLKYDGVFVRNEGDNYVPTTFFRCNAADVEAMSNAGWQAIKFQSIGGWDPDFEYHVIFVQTDNPYWVKLDGTSQELEDIEATYGRMIDLRGPKTPSPATFLNHQ